MSWLILTKNGYIKRACHHWITQRRGVRTWGSRNERSDDDYVEKYDFINTRFTSSLRTQGKFLLQRVWNSWIYSRTAKGITGYQLINIDSAEKIQVDTSVFQNQMNPERYLFFTLRGTAKRVRLSNSRNIRANGLRHPITRRWWTNCVVVTSGNDGIILERITVTLSFHEDKVRAMGSYRFRCSWGFLREGDYVIGILF